MGGAAGHMAHPFDLNWVDTGSDLLDFFERAKTFVDKKGAGAVKIDGVNVSFKVVGDDVKQFAVDRGSLKPIDIEGITLSRVEERFPEGHGMRPALTTLLTILNTAIDDIKPELEALGMWDDPSRFLNSEYVSGQTNVMEYGDNFLAIHGLNQFYHRIGKVGAAKGVERPGMERPEGVKASSVEIPYDPAVMERLVEKLRPIAEQYNFKVYSSVPTEKLEGVEVDFSNVLGQPLTIQISDDREITKSLGEWLQEASNPRYKTIKLKDGKRTHPLHKQLYLNVLNRTAPIVDLIDEEDAQAAIYGTVFLHATRMLGNEILKGLTSPMGDVIGHEGVVLRDENLFGPNPVKITGEFIVGGMGSGFGTVQEVEEESFEVVEDEDADPVVDSEYTPQRKETIAIVPGAFKPPHRGHAEMVQKYANMADKVIILISKPTKKGRYLDDGKNKTEILQSHAEKIWRDIFLPDISGAEIVIDTESPYASPIQAAYDYIGPTGPLDPERHRVILGASSKPDSSGIPDWHRWMGVENSRSVKPGLEIMDIEENAVECTDRSCGTPFSATVMREIISQLRKNPNDRELRQQLSEFVPAERIDDLLAIFPFKESSMSGGAVGGYSGHTPLSSSDDEDDSIIVQENIDINLVEEVLELIIGRGLRYE